MTPTPDAPAAKDLAVAPFRLYAESLAAAQQGMTVLFQAYATAVERLCLLSFRQFQLCADVGQIVAQAGKAAEPAAETPPQPPVRLGLGGVEPPRVGERPGLALVAERPAA